MLFLVAAALPFTKAIGRAFLPEFNEGALTISAVTLPGTALPESDQLGRIVERTILSHPEVKSVGRRTGRAELDEHAQGAEASELDVSFQLKDADMADEIAKTLLGACRAEDFRPPPGSSPRPM